MQSLPECEPQLLRHLKSVFGVEPSIESMAQVFGGASRETWLIHAVLPDGGDKRLVMRRTQPSSLIETEQEVESGAMKAFAGSGLPVPEVFSVAGAGSPEAEALDAPFMLVGELPGAPSSPFDLDPYGAHKQSIGEDFWQFLGRIAGDRGAAQQFASFSPTPAVGDCWRLELEKWEKMIASDSLGPEPILQAAIRWLRNNPPPPPERLVPVHGDYRSGNFMHEGGRITAVLDWEMAHLGDPHEDIAWAMAPLWCQHNPSLPAALLDRQQSLQHWSAASGLQVDAKALHWWEVFAGVKGMAIWISAGHEFLSGSNEQPVNLLSSWLCSDIQLQTLIHLLAPNGTPGAEQAA